MSKTTKVTKHFCSECGNQVYDYCQEHPGAMVDSVESAGDATDVLIEKAISWAARAFKAEFETLRLDTEWSKTAYASLPVSAQKRISWSGFHNAVQGTLEA